MRRMTRPIRHLAALVVSLILVLGVVSPAHADDPGKYYDGRIAYSQVINCPSIIWGSPYTEFGVGAYTGYYADPDSGVPGVGQPVYLHVVVYGLGNPCSGGTYFWPSVKLPAGVAPYTGAPINCYYDGAPMTGANCPQWTNFGGAGPHGSVRYTKNLADGGDTWGVAQGHVMEFQIPIVGSAVVSGASLTSYVETADGNDDPTLTLTAPLYVFGGGSPGAVMYDQPSTYTSAVLPGTSTPSKFGIISEFQAVAQGQAGTALMGIGTKSGSYPEKVKLALPAGYSSVRIWTDWDETTVTPLVPGKKYFWRGGWDPGAAGGGDVVWGAEQTFVAPGGKTCLGLPVTVNLGVGEVPTGGDDVILGTPGSDKISGAGGNDRICGLGGGDVIDGGDGNDLVDAGGGNDTVAQVAGDDGAKGGAGVDTISYAGSTTRITLNLAVATEQVTGAGLDIVTGFENAVGGNLADTIKGSGGANTLIGTGGADSLKGQAGKDKLVGGKGSDTCAGGPGKDTATTCEHKSSIP